MKIQHQPGLGLAPRSLPGTLQNKEPQGNPPGDQFQPQETPPEKTHTSWFHRATGAISGAATLATVGVMLIGPMGNGMGGNGLIYPAMGLLAGAGGGLIGGAIAAGQFSSSEEKTSLFHRTTAVVGGAVAGGILGVMLIGPGGNGRGADGLMYPIVGLAGGSALGAIGLGLAAGHFPDKKG